MRTLPKIPLTYMYSATKCYWKRCLFLIDVTYFDYGGKILFLGISTIGIFLLRC